MKHTLLLIFNAICLTVALEAQDYNILRYGAVKNDTAELSTSAINKAIDVCFKEGGGTVVIPAGMYKSGTIFFRDNVEIKLSPGATLYASKNYNDFPANGLIYADSASNISITGKGIIDGQGEGRTGKERPSNILFKFCKNISVERITMRNSGGWNQHYFDCQDVMVSHIHVYDHSNKNNDGIDINGCKRFLFSNSIIDSDDDGIVLKSTGLARCENITITNCIVSSYTNAIKCGTESIGGFKNITISNCVIKPTRSKVASKFNLPRLGISGISLEIVDGGIMEGVNINNIVIEGTQCPIYVRLGNRVRKVNTEAATPSFGQMRDIQLNNITAYNTGNYSSSITGIPGAKIENISLNNIRMVNEGDVKPGEYLADYSKVKEDEKGYPQPTDWGNLPSYGFFIRHVKNIALSNFILGSVEADKRLAVIGVDIDYLSVKDLFLDTGKDPICQLKDVKNYQINRGTVEVLKD